MRLSIRVKLFGLIIGLLGLFTIAFISVTALYQDDFFIGKYEDNHVRLYEIYYSEFDTFKDTMDYFRQYERELKGFITVFDSEYNIIESTSPMLVKASKLPSEYNEYYTKLKNAEGQNYILFSVLEEHIDEKVLYLIGLLPNGHIVMLEKPLGFMTEALEISNHIIFSVGAGVLAIGIVLAYYMAYVFTKPIIKINKTALAISNLEFDSHLNIKNKDEIGDLGHTINQISQTLKDYLDEIEVQNEMLEVDKNKLEVMNHQLKEISETDTLTQLSNRLKIDRVLEYEVKRAKLTGSTFSVIIIDIDHFKSVNDTYGHLIGDEVLKNLASLLKSNSRSLDIVGRWGGEEFILVLPDTNQLNAYNKAEFLRTVIEEYTFDEVGQKTASFGVGEYNVDNALDNLISKVDDALYRAKDGGRNRVEQI